MMDPTEDKGLIQEFVRESREMLDNAEVKFVELDCGQAADVDVINAVFRMFHSIKGCAGFLSFHNILLVTHEAESLLSLFRKAKVKFLPCHAELLCQACDFMRRVLVNIESVANDYGFEAEAKDMVGLLRATIADACVAGGLATPGRPVLENLVQPVQPKSAAATDLPHALPNSACFHESLAQESNAGRMDIRVDVAKLDMLNNLVGELAIVAGMVANNQDLIGLRLGGFEYVNHRLGMITAQLQKVSMALRMVPVSAAFRKMIRQVHDLAAKSGKKVELKLIGEDIEVDKNVVELIGDPLMHLVRNSIDHGLESPEGRQAAGKPEIGTITLEARHQAGAVWILISDDGCGLDRTRILAKGIESGLVAGDGHGMSDDEAFALIFEPGFSTSDRITDISGRGVGMDVVRKNIEKLRGRVQLENRTGQGLTVMLMIPLTHS